MHSTHVMDGAGFYNRHSVQQHEAADAGISMLRRAATDTVLSARDAPLIADLGCSQGKNSMHPIGIALDVWHARTDWGGASVSVVHTDLPDNDFASLFATIDRDPDSYRRPGVYSFAAGRSFYERLFPDRTVTLGWSATAALWLSGVPCPLPDHLFSFMATGDERARWHAYALDDWRTFLSHRAVELSVGGELVVNLPVAGPHYQPWMTLVEGGARDAVDAGAIRAEEHAAMVVPTYLHELDELAREVRACTGLELAEVEDATAPDPAYERFEQDGDASRYAAGAVALMRAWSEPSLVSSLDPDRTDAERTAAADGLYEHIAARLEAQPTECPWTIGLLRIRREA